MATRTIAVTPSLHDYILDVSLREHPAGAKLRAETAKHPYAGMQVSPVQGQLLQFLARLIGARKVIEVGVFTGYSALCVAQALPPDGKLVALDVSHEFVDVGRPFWAEAGVADRIDVRVGDGRDTLDRMIASGESGNYDMAFIDADKVNYQGYVERALRLIRPGGLLAIDNVLWGGSVADASEDDEDTKALRALNAKLKTDERVDIVMIPAFDGLTLARKR